MVASASAACVVECRRANQALFCQRPLSDGFLGSCGTYRSGGFGVFLGECAGPADFAAQRRCRRVGDRRAALFWSSNDTRR